VKLTNADLATLIDALRDAEAYRRSIIDAELPPRSVPRCDWEKDDLDNEAIWKQSVARFRKLRRRLERMESNLSAPSARTARSAPEPSSPRTTTRCAPARRRRRPTARASPWPFASSASRACTSKRPGAPAPAATTTRKSAPGPPRWRSRWPPILQGLRRALDVAHGRGDAVYAFGYVEPHIVAAVRRYAETHAGQGPESRARRAQGSGGKDELRPHHSTRR